MSKSVLLTEDDQVQREVIEDILTHSGFEVQSAASAEEALAALGEGAFDLLLTDLKMPGMDGLELLRETRKLRPDLDVVVMTAHGTIKTAVTAMKVGAADYLEKPFDKDELLHVVNRAIERRSLREENRQLRELVTESVALGNIIGDAPVMRQVFQRTTRVTQVPSTVLILGESGTGKELIARHIHFAGPRREKPFVVVNCAAIPDTLVESELFGHEKGAFTGADATRPGKFEKADRGTIFLDEIGDMPLEAQAKLLRVLQDGVVERVGSTTPRQVDTRVIVATNRDLKTRVNEGAFREDLYYRLDVLTIQLPPLRDRMEDLPHLVSHFREKLGKRLGVKPPRLAPEVLDAFQRYTWPGNVRELEHTLEQLIVLATGDTLTADDLPEKLRKTEPRSGDFSLPPGGLVLEDLEQDLIRQALERSDGSIKDAAGLLGLSYKTLQYRLKKHDIDRKEIG
jgi:DNA-binding NtrC family response regulator